MRLLAWYQANFVLATISFAGYRTFGSTFSGYVHYNETTKDFERHDKKGTKSGSEEVDKKANKAISNCMDVVTNQLTRWHNALYDRVFLINNDWSLNNAPGTLTEKITTSIDKLTDFNSPGGLRRAWRQGIRTCANGNTGFPASFGNILEGAPTSSSNNNPVDLGAVNGLRMRERGMPNAFETLKYLEMSPDNLLGDDWDALDLTLFVSDKFENAMCSTHNVSAYHLGLQQVAPDNKGFPYHFPDTGLFAGGNNDTTGVHTRVLKRLTNTWRSEDTWYERYFLVHRPKMEINTKIKQFGANLVHAQSRISTQGMGIQAQRAMKGDSAEEVGCQPWNIWARPQRREPRHIFSQHDTDLINIDETIIEVDVAGGKLTVLKADSSQETFTYISFPDAWTSNTVGTVKQIKGPYGPIYIEHNNGTQYVVDIAPSVRPDKPDPIVKDSRRLRTNVDNVRPDHELYDITDGEVFVDQDVQETYEYVKDCDCDFFKATELERSSPQPVVQTCQDKKDFYTCQSCCGSDRDKTLVASVDFRGDIVDINRPPNPV